MTTLLPESPDPGELQGQEIEPVVLVPATDSGTGPTINYDQAEDIRELLDGAPAIVVDAEVGEELLDDNEVYRGEPAPPLQQPSPMPRATALTFETRSVASSDSSSSINVGRRFGAIAVAVEQAITRWAKSKSSGSSTTSSSSSSSSSSASSIRTRTTRKKRKRRHSGSISVLNAAKERELLERRRAQEESRVTPREFTLFLPPELANMPTRKAEGVTQVGDVPSGQESKRVIQTTALPEILEKLDASLKRSARARKARMKDATGALAAEALRKGKSRAHGVQSGGNSGTQTPDTSPNGGSQRGWWLDVASPTWADLRSIGKLLHLHPLTLEDILHKEPREKLELFPGLGYYFIIFRALEGAKSRERFRQASGHLMRSSGDEGVIGAVNVYLVVFREGVLSFHFEDISEHTERLLSKILKLENTYRMTSDWIAHGLLDSIVDAFFPVLTGIEKEVKEVDALVLGTKRANAHAEDEASQESEGTGSLEKLSSDASNEKIEVSDTGFIASEKMGMVKKQVGYKAKASVQFSHIFWPVTFVAAQVKDLVGPFLQRRAERRFARRLVAQQESMYTTGKTLLRMAATRRIVTSLGRLLGTKAEVITQIRKRLAVESRGSNGRKQGLDMQDDGEIAMYMGDVQDHIVTLLQSLYHYERMLSSSHPAYLSQLRLSQSTSKGGTDKNILVLTVVSMSVLSIQLILGLFSINVNIPNNKVSGSFTIFFIILGVTLVVGCIVPGLVRFWMWHAKRKYTRRRRI